MNRDLVAVGMIEFTSIAAGMNAADRMMKTADITPVFFKTICPGKFLACIGGDVASVSAALDAGRDVAPESVADWFLIPNIHPDVLRCLGGGTTIAEDGALGIIETFSAAGSVYAADAAVKAASVQIFDIRTALGLGGKGFTMLVGDVAAVEAAVEAGVQKAAENGLLVGKTIIPRPAKGFFEKIM